MSNAHAVRIAFENLRSLGFASISGTYAGVGAPFANPVRQIKISNFMDDNLLISFNGINDKDVVAANGFCLYDYTSNRTDSGGNLEQPAGIRIYVKQESGAPTSGNVYVTVIYASEV